MKTTTYQVEHGTARIPTLGRSLEAILATPRSELPFFHVTTRVSHVPPARSLRFNEVRETGPRSGISFRLGHTTDRPWRTDGDLTAAAAAQVLPRIAAAKTATEYVFVYAAPHYGSRCRVMARHDGPTRKVTVTHPRTGEVFTVAACDTEVAQ